jgi:hypothetical protein
VGQLHGHFHCKPCDAGDRDRGGQRNGKRPRIAITTPAAAKSAATAHAPRYFPASARMIAERAEQGTKVMRICHELDRDE